MRTKHVLMAIALPTIFAACTSDEIENPSVNVDFNRPAVGDVKVVLGGIDSRRVDAETGSASWTESMGACLMDSPVSGAAPTATFAEKYALKNTVETDYPFTLEDNAWSTTGLLLEGNYFFYYPAKVGGMKRGEGLTYEVKASQNAYDANGNWKRYQAETDNQMWISYKGFEANTVMEDAEIKLNMAPLHAAVNFKVQYDGTNSMEIRKIVLKKKSGVFANTGKLYVAGIVTTAEYAVENVDTLAAGANLPALFNVYNNEATDASYTTSTEYNPLLQAAYLQKTGNGVPAIEVNFKNQVLTSGQSVTASMVVPNDIDASGYDVVVYTDKGVVEYNTVAPLEYKATDKLVDLTASNEANYRKQFTSAVVYVNNEEIEDDEKLEAVQPQGAVGIILSFKDKAIQVSKNFDVASTSDLDMYMSYHEYQGYTSNTTLTATLTANDVELSEDVYDILKANNKITLNLKNKGSEVKLLNISSELNEDAINLIVPGPKTGFAVKEGAVQKIVHSGDFKNVYNEGTLTIDVPAVAPATVPVKVEFVSLHNAGTLTVNSPVEVRNGAFVNGCVGTLGTNNTNVKTSAVLNVASTIANDIVNYANVNVTAAANSFKYTSAILTIGTGNNAPKTAPALTLAASKTLTLSNGSVAYGSITNNGTLTLDGDNYGTFTNNKTATVKNNYGIINNDVAIPNGQLTVTNNKYVSATSYGVVNNTVEKSMVNFETNEGNIYAVAGSYVNDGTEPFVGTHAEVGNVIFTIKESIDLATLITENRSVLNSSTALVVDNGATFTLNLETEEVEAIDGTKTIQYTAETQEYLEVLARIKAITINESKVFVNGDLKLMNCPIYVYGNSEVTGSYGSTIDFIGVTPSNGTDFHKKHEILTVKEDAFLTVGVAVEGLTKVVLEKNAKVLADNVVVSGEAIVMASTAEWFGKSFVTETAE